jgi:predicted permease
VTRRREAGGPRDREFRITDYAPDARADAEEEVRHYLEEREAELRAEGHSPEEARQMARERFGDPEEVVGAVEAVTGPRIRAGRRSQWLASLVEDVRFTIRTLSRAPGFALMAVLTLGLGIGANTAIFSVASAALLRQPPVQEPERLVSIYTTCRSGEPRCASSYPDYMDYREGQSSIEDLSAVAGMPVSLGLRGAAARLVDAELVSGNYFSLLGLTPAGGRLLQPADDQLGSDPAVVVVSHALWRAGMGADPDAVGRTLLINRTPFTVIGVAPEGFRGLTLASPADVWISIRALDALGEDGSVLAQRGARWIGDLVGRLAAGVTVELARSEMRALSDRLAELDPAARGPRSITVDRPGGYIVPGRDPAALDRFVFMLHGVVGVTLLLACANLANLLLARATARSSEMGLRRALGAGRNRIVRQLVTESLVLALAGGGAGVGLAALMLIGLSSLALPFGFTIAGLDPELDARVLAFAFGLTLAAGLVFGLAPAIRTSRVSPSEALRQSRSGPTPGTARFQAGLVAVQVALSLVLLTGAGLFIRALRDALTENYGFETEGLALFAFDPSSAGHSGPSAAELIRSLAERAEVMTGVSTVSVGRDVPLLGATLGTLVTVDGYQAAPDEEMRIELNFADPGWFATLGIRIVEGRDLSNADSGPGGHVAVISRTMADRWWPGRSAVGGTFNIGSRAVRVVGVVEDTYYDGIQAEQPPHVTLALPQNQSRYAAVVVMAIRTDRPGDAASLLPALAVELRALDDRIPIILSSTMRNELGRILAPQRLTAWLMGGFSILALILAAVGLYGLVNYAVTRRLPELAVRSALGARAGELRGALVLRHAWPLAIGTAAGVVGALALTPLAAAFLLGLPPRDPATIAAVVAVLLITGLLAVLLPTLRLERIDPMKVLRVE